MLKSLQDPTLIQLALGSRLIIISLQLISNSLITDHDAGVFTAPKPLAQNASTCNNAVEILFGGFRRWDAEYFLHIAENGYSYENVLAFYPLYPMAVRFATNTVQLIIPDCFQCSYPSLLLATSIALNMFFFCMAVGALYKLSLLILNDRYKSKLAAVLFCLNPAGIFFTASYTESLFSWLTFEVMIKCFEMKFMKAIIPLCLSMLCRSNGILNMGFVLFYAAKSTLANLSMLKLIKTSGKLILVVAAALITFSFLQMYYYLLYCTDYKVDLSDHVIGHGHRNNFVIAGQMNVTSEWCSYVIPLSYSYIQSHYWNVGFLKYYEIKQIPNFLLAFPILYVFIFHSIAYLFRNPATCLRLGLSRSNADNMFVYVVHGFSLSTFCLFFVHIQVSTRMLASSGPCLYWFVVEYFCEDRDRPSDTSNFNIFMKILYPSTKCGKLIRNWFLIYNFIGTILFSNFLPWT